MSQSNRHWPSMFRSKPCPSSHQWQHDHNPFSTNSKAGYAAGEDKSPDPKPRWNPKPEQIRILEGIFNSGVVNPPRDEIRKIRCQLQEYGQVGDANVFYWFQNRKSRSKNKSRARNTPRATPPAKTLAAAPKRSSPSSASEISSSNVQKKATLGLSALSEMTNSPTTSVTQTLFTPTTGDSLQEPLLLPVHQGTSAMTQGLYFSDFTSLFQMHDQAAGHLSYTGLFQELMVDQDDIKKEDEEKMRMNCYTFVNTPAHFSSGGTALVSDSTATAPGDLQVGIAAMAPPAAMRVMQVFINNEAYEIGPGLLNIREAFGNKILVHISGQHIPTDEWGVTLQPLQHGSSYYLLSVEE